MFVWLNESFIVEKLFKPVSKPSVSVKILARICPYNLKRHVRGSSTCTSISLTFPRREKNPYSHRQLEDAGCIIAEIDKWVRSNILQVNEVAEKLMATRLSRIAWGGDNSR